MSGLQDRNEDTINGVDVREQGNALRVATNTPHLVSLGTGRLSTAVTLHPIKQGRVTIGSDPTCDIYVVGRGVASVHCRVENSHGVVTLYPVCGSTLVDHQPIDKPTRLSQGSMLTIGRSNYLRFNHPAEAKLMKSVLPSAHVSMAPMQFAPNEQCIETEYVTETNQCYQTMYHDPLSQYDQELDLSLKEITREKPPLAPKKYQNEDQDDKIEKPKMTSIMAKVSKFEYYAKQNKIGRSQFYTNEYEISPKVFSSNSLTVNTPAKDVLGVNKPLPNYMRKPEKYDSTDKSDKYIEKSERYNKKSERYNEKSERYTEKEKEEFTEKSEKIVLQNDNNSLDAKNCSYANVAIKNNKLGDLVKNFDEKLPKKVNNESRDNVYGKINTNRQENSQKDGNFKEKVQECGTESSKGAIFNGNLSDFDQTAQYKAVYSSRQFDRGMDAENMRNKAYQERVKEEEKKEAEMERLEEILDIFTEYQKQLNSDMRGGLPITPTEKRPHNKIITNGSLPRNGAFNYANLVKTSDGYYKFDTSHNRSQKTTQRNVSSYENFEPNELTPEISLPDANYENVGRMDEIGIPVFDELNPYQKEVPSTTNISNIPSPSPYENLYANRNIYNNLKPKSPNTNSPRSKIKTTFAHKNLPSPQYFIFPTPPPTNRKPDFGEIKPFGEQKSNSGENKPNIGENKSNLEENIPNLGDNKPKSSENRLNLGENRSNFAENTMEDKRIRVVIENQGKETDNQTNKSQKFPGIEKQLSVEGEIPMIDDTGVTNDIELRYSQIIKETEDSKPKDENTNKSFEDVKKELMADIPELEAFEKDLKDNKREKIIKNLSQEINIIKDIDIEQLDDSKLQKNISRNTDISTDYDNSVLDINIDDLKSNYERLKEERKGIVAEIHEIKCKMAEIRSQEDDILRELEMEKALIKGEYDSEIAILNIEQKKKTDLVEKAKKIEQEIRELKEKQEIRQNDMRERVEIATMKVERIEKDMKTNAATVEELQNAQDILDNETKIYEDLEFQHLEEESELLSNREDIQNEIILITKKIEAQKTRILTLKSEANNNLTSALDETKVLHAEYVKLLNKVEDLTSKVQSIEKDLKPVVAKLNEIERAQSPDSAFYTDQTRGKSGEFSYSPQSSDSDEIDPKINFEEHTKEIKNKFNSIDQMSQSMIVDIERRIDRFDSPKKEKEKKGFWERNFDSLKRKKKPKSPDKVDKVDIMSQSLNENLFYNNDSIENDTLDRLNSLRNSKKKDKDKEKATGPIKSNSSSKIPTFAALGKIIKKDSFTKKSKDIPEEENSKIRYIKNLKPVSVENKYMKSKSLSPDKINNRIVEEFEPDNFQNGATAKILHRKSCGDEPNDMDLKDRHISDRIPSQDDIDRISKVTIDAPLIASDTDMNSLGKRTLDSLMEVERKRFEMLEEQGCQVIENEREKIIELKRRAQDETKKLWDQKYREKSIDSDTFNSLNENRNSTGSDRNPTEKVDQNTERAEMSNFEGSSHFNRSSDFDKSNNFDRAKIFDEANRSNNFDRSSNFDRTRNFDDPNRSNNFDRSNHFDRTGKFDRSGGLEESSLMDDSFMTNSTIFEESSGLVSSSIEELQVRNSRTESTEDDKRSDDSRPLSHVSDFSRDNILCVSGAPRRSRRAIAPYPESQRPLTRYLPVDRDDFDLQSHLHCAGHQLELCPYVTVTSTSCRGYLHKLGAKFHTWSKRWFVFDRETKTFVYYWDKSEKKPRGGAYFQVIEEVYLDHGNTSKSPSPQTTFIVKTRQRRYYLMAPSGEAARIWIDAIFTGAQGYTEYLE